jgi:hypothetical protein
MEYQVLIGGTMLDQILVGGITSLVNLIIHAGLLGAVVWTVRHLSTSEAFVPAFLQYTIVIVATGTLLVAGNFLEVVLSPHTYDWVGAAPRGPISSISPSATIRRSATATIFHGPNGICLGR